MPLALLDELIKGVLRAGPVGGELVKGGVETAQVGEVMLVLELLVGDDMIIFRIAVGCTQAEVRSES